MTPLEIDAAARAAATARPFRAWAHAWRGFGLAVLPVDRESKRPLVSRFNTWRVLPAAQTVENWCEKYPCANIGILTGPLTGLTVVDLDDVTDAALKRRVLERFGDTPLKVASGSGRSEHWYYRSRGERCRVRVDGLPVDVRGAGGFVVAPGSVHWSTGSAYRLIAGSFDALARLPSLRPLDPTPDGRAAPTATAAAGADGIIAEGFRNETLFRGGLQAAHTAPDHESLRAELLRRNLSQCRPPLPEAEVDRIAASLWGYKQSGALWVASGGVLLPHAACDMLVKEPDALAVAMLALRFHSGKAAAQFALSPKGLPASGRLTMCASRVRAATLKLESLGALRVVHPGGKGRNDPRLYSFGPLLMPSAKGAEVIYNTKLHRPPAPPAAMQC